MVPDGNLTWQCLRKLYAGPRESKKGRPPHTPDKMNGPEKCNACGVPSHALCLVQARTAYRRYAMPWEFRYAENERLVLCPQPKIIIKESTSSNAGRFVIYCPSHTLGPINRIIVPSGVLFALFFPPRFCILKGCQTMDICRTKQVVI